jgi:hypothetical protein
MGAVEHVALGRLVEWTVEQGAGNVQFARVVGGLEEHGAAAPAAETSAGCTVFVPVQGLLRIGYRHAPWARWQRVQWQCATHRAGNGALNATAPQRQLPWAVVTGLSAGVGAVMT